MKKYNLELVNLEFCQIYQYIPSSQILLSTVSLTFGHSCRSSYHTLFLPLPYSSPRLHWKRTIIILFMRAGLVGCNSSTNTN